MISEIRHIEPGRPARQGQLILERRYEIAHLELDHVMHGGSCLDIGCGNGAQTAYFLDDFENTIGFDIIHLNSTENPIKDSRLQFIQGDSMLLPFCDNQFDLVTSFEVLEHVPRDRTVAGEIYRVLKQGGYFFFSVPNRWWIFETHGANLPDLNWIPWNRVPFISWLPKEIHDRIARARIYTIAEAVRLVESVGFTVMSSGYITAPMDVLPDGKIRKALRKKIFRTATTHNPFLAVNLYVVCKKEA